MDAIDILGSLLGQKSGGGGLGGKILRDILGGGGGGGGQPQPQSRTQPQSRPAPQRTPSNDLEGQARELEDLLNVANGRSQRRSPPAEPQRPQVQRPEPQRPQVQRPNPIPQPRDKPFGQERAAPSRYEAPQAPSWQQLPPEDPTRQNEQAIVLIRAMINAAKSDGQISQEEQQQILERIGDTSQDTIQFLRDEFARPLDVREFAWCVPLGMEQQVYTMSLVAIDFDSNREAGYLRELAHGLRLCPSVCEQIHQRLGIPPLP